MKYVYERHLFSTAGGHLWQSSHLNSHCYINHAKIKLFFFTKIIEIAFTAFGNFWELSDLNKNNLPTKVTFAKMNPTLVLTKENTEAKKTSWDPKPL